MYKTPKERVAARLEKLKDLAENHPYYSRLIKRLSPADMAAIRSVLEESGYLDRNHLTLEIYRLYLDAERPRNYSTITDVLLASRDEEMPEPVEFRLGDRVHVKRRAGVVLGVTTSKNATSYRVHFVDGTEILCGGHEMTMMPGNEEDE